METNEQDLKLVGFEQYLTEQKVKQQRDSLILAIAEKLYDYEWVQQTFPEYYNHCLHHV